MRDYIYIPYHRNKNIIIINKNVGRDKGIEKRKREKKDIINL